MYGLNGEKKEKDQSKLLKEFDFPLDHDPDNELPKKDKKAKLKT
jgi:hypothetical protein